MQLRPQKLQFLQLAEWDERNSYDEETPTCLHYISASKPTPTTLGIGDEYPLEVHEGDFIKEYAY
jgi:hypothetical protein